MQVPTENNLISIGFCHISHGFPGKQLVNVIFHIIIFIIIISLCDIGWSFFGLLLSKTLQNDSKCTRECTPATYKALSRKPDFTRPSERSCFFRVSPAVDQPCKTRHTLNFNRRWYNLFLRLQKIHHWKG